MLCYVVLCCVVLCCVQLFCFVLFCFALLAFLCFALLCFVLFCFALLCFVLFCFVLFCFVLFCFVLFCFVLFCFVLFCFVLSSLVFMLNFLAKVRKLVLCLGTCDPRTRKNPVKLSFARLHEGFMAGGECSVAALSPLVKEDVGRGRYGCGSVMSPGGARRSPSWVIMLASSGRWVTCHAALFTVGLDMSNGQSVCPSVCLFLLVGRSLWLRVYV